jgi:hypothetical protein
LPFIFIDIAIHFNSLDSFNKTEADSRLMVEVNYIEEVGGMKFLDVALDGKYREIDLFVWDLEQLSYPAAFIW